MKLYAWLTVYLTLFITEILCGKIPDAVPPAADRCSSNYGTSTYYHICFPGGGGYHSYNCKVKDWMKRKYEWDLHRTFVCPKDKTACQCWAVGEDFHPNCECYNPLPPPSFPPTGIIRWTGTKMRDDHFYVGGLKPIYSPEEGEAHKMANGQFLLSEYDGFEIYIPDGAKGFIKYTGRHGNKHCKTRHVDTSGDLSSVWNKRPYGYEKKVYRLDKTTPLDGKESMQTWRRYHEDDEGDWLWIWEVKYDSELKYAIPVQYNYQSHGWFDYELDQTKLVYKYESIKGNEKSFKLEDFCNN